MEKSIEYLKGGNHMHINENIMNKLTDEQKSKVSGGSFPCHHCQYDACPKKEVESPSW